MKSKKEYVCRDCGHSEIKWMGQCPACREWNTLEEFRVSEPGRKGRPEPSRGEDVPRVRALSEIDPLSLPRYRTETEEFDRVLGGGLVPGSLTLMAGDPGVGKSTLLLQAASAYARRGLRVLYLSAEESDRQIRRRSNRLEGIDEAIQVLCTTRLEIAAPLLTRAEIDVLMVDSVQTLHHGDAGSAPGSVSQVRDNTLFFLEFAKRSQIPVILVGHVTKEGGLAGPRVMEHMVDAVLHLDGDPYHQFRILRVTKNRFGPTHEVGVFTMGERGLTAVTNPSELLLAERRRDAVGSAVLVTLEGTRPLLLEVQALTSGSGFQNPRRVSTGFDSKRLALILAVLEKHAHISFSGADVFLNVAGGFRISEPAAELAVAAALASSFYEQALAPDTVFVGEIGLGGELRRVAQTERRLQEAAKLGFTRAVVPARSGLPEGVDLDVESGERVADVLDVMFGAARGGPRVEEIVT